MKIKLEETITELERIQVWLMAKRKDYHGIVPVDKIDDINHIQTTIEILKNLIIEPDYIWRNKKN